MIKNTIKCCFCFLDRSVWFVNSPDYSMQLWRFGCFKPSVERFIRKNTLCYEIDKQEIVLNNQMTISCVRCFEFQLFLFSCSNEMMKIFDDVKCRQVALDAFTFGDGFDDDIFIGNLSDVEDNLLSHSEREKLFKKFKEKNEGNFVRRRPLRKSCFISLRKKSYECFCVTCKKIYDDFFIRELYSIMQVE